MRRNLTLVGKMGIVLALIGFVMLLYYLIAIFATVGTIIPPSSIIIVAMLLGVAGMLMNIRNRQAKQTPSS